MDTFDENTSKPSTIQENSLFESENTNQTDDSSRNPTTSDNVTSSEIPTISNNDLVENTNEITNNQRDDFSWFTENHPTTSNDATSSEIPTVSNNNPFENYEQSYTLPPTVEDIFSDNSINQQSDYKSSFNLFSNDEFSPLEAINKKRAEEIAAKDAEENRKIQQLREEAKTDLENWYNERRRQMEQKLQTMKNQENDLYKKTSGRSSKGSCDWSKVIRLIDFADGKQSTQSKRDLTRMKTCIFNAKRFDDMKKLSNGN